MAPNARELKLRQFLLEEYETKNSVDDALKHIYERFGNGCIKSTKIKYWFRRFKRGNKTLTIDESHTKINDHVSETENEDRESFSDESTSSIAEDRISENGSETSDDSIILEKQLRSQLPKIIANYASRLKGGNFKNFTQRIRDAIWNHFSDEDKAFEKVRINRPGYDQRKNQVKQAQGVLARVFNQITTPTQLSFFVRDYVSVLKSSNSVQNLNERILITISEHQSKSQQASIIIRFCAIQ